MYFAPLATEARNRKPYTAAGQRLKDVGKGKKTYSEAKLSSQETPYVMLL